MKKIIFMLTAFFLILNFPLRSQQISEEAFVINIEVPVRVYKSGQFVDNLTIDDFEVLENGVPQKIEAVYLIKKRAIERRQEKKRFSPHISRNYFLFFEISDYTPKIGDAVDYFIHKVVIPGDNLIIVSPMKTYRMTAKAFEFYSKDALASQLKKILRRDTTVGYSEYRHSITELMGLAESLSEEGSSDARTEFSAFDETITTEFKDLPLDKKLMRYGNILHRIEKLRRVDQQKLLNFARYLKTQKGQKYVFLFYQREFIPQIEPTVLDQFMTVYQNRPDIIQTVSGLFEFYKREIPFDVDLVKQTFADSSISIHFLFITTTPKRVPGVYFQERSEDIYSAFREMARATGGFLDSSANPEFLFKEALQASENYYLLYYSPSNYKSDGQFKKIEVRVKNKNYKVVHRLGYFAN
ncbi:MAG: hypothetical protein ACE5GI_01045 [Candidatus Aminicenantales bacterium]